MRRKNEAKNECVADVGSVTSAMHAQALLRDASIPTRVVRTGTGDDGGCSFGVSFRCEEQYRLGQVLALAGIPIRRIRPGGSYGRGR